LFYSEKIYVVKFEENPVSKKKKKKELCI